MGKPGLYIHIPFCVKKCAYCDFLSFAGKEDYMGRYASAVIEEARLWNSTYKDMEFATVYIGGGTPSFLHRGLISRVLNGCREHLNVVENAEVSIEANPGTLTAAKLDEYLGCGINRLSIGAQSSSDRLLALLGRAHTRKDFFAAYRMAREAGFRNINIDLIFGLPTQTAAEWESTLEEILSCSPEHVSCYGLKLEEGTPLQKACLAGEYLLPDEEEERGMADLARKVLDRQGYRRYEISNYAQKGFECRHNLNYWDCGEYLALGLGAHSCGRDGESRLVRWENRKDLQGYIESVEAGQKPVEKAAASEKPDEIFEYIMLRLRLTEGVVYEQYRSRFGQDFLEKFGEKAGTLVRQGHAKANKRRFYLTPKGMDVQNPVLLFLLSQTP